VAALKNKPRKSIIHFDKSLPKRLESAESLSYEACKGYSKPNMRDNRGVTLPDNFHVDNSVTIPFGTVLSFG
jgi:hypothetical protein